MAVLFSEIPIADSITDMSHQPISTDSLLRDEFARKPEAHLLVHRETPEGPLLGTVWLEPKDSQTWYLGLLTVRPDQQANGLGKSILEGGRAWIKYAPSSAPLP